MSRNKTQMSQQIARYARAEAGVATVDWVVLFSAATGAAFLALNISQDTLAGYSGDVRTELQDPYFETEWTTALEIPPEDVWGNEGTILTTYDADDPTNGTLDGRFVPNPSDTPDDTDDGYGTDDGSGTGSGGNSGGNTGGNTGNNGGGGSNAPTFGPITLANASFESRPHPDGSWLVLAPSWTTTTTGQAEAGDYDPGAARVDPNSYDGQNVAYMYHTGTTYSNAGANSSSSMSQTTGETYSTQALYEFSLDIGDGNGWPSGNDPYQINIYAGDTVIGTQSGVTGDIGALQTVTLVSDVVDPALDGQPIRFEVVQLPHADGSEILFDNVVGMVLENPNAPGGGGPTPPVYNIPTSPVLGCPTIDFAGPVSTRTGAELDNMDLNVDVTAGGATHMSTCSDVPGWGYFNANPSFTMELSDMETMTELEIETRDSCDTTLLVRDAQGNFYFDDDGGSSYSRFASKLKFRSDQGFDMSLFNGRVDVWVGTYSGNSCSDLRVEVDTID